MKGFSCNPVISSRLNSVVRPVPEERGPRWHTPARTVDSRAADQPLRACHTVQRQGKTPSSVTSCNAFDAPQSSAARAHARYGDAAEAGQRCRSQAQGRVQRSRVRSGQIAARWAQHHHKRGTRLGRVAFPGRVPAFRRHRRCRRADCPLRARVLHFAKVSGWRRCRDVSRLCAPPPLPHFAAMGNR